MLSQAMNDGLMMQELMKKIDSQLDFATSKHKGDVSLVSLTDINKYVGYSTAKLRVDFLETIGTVRQFKQSRYGKVRFPLKDVKINRATGDVTINNDDFMKVAPIQRESILEVKICRSYTSVTSAQSFREEINSRSDPQSNRQKQRTEQEKSNEGYLEEEKSMSIEQVEQWLRSSSKQNLNRPVDYSMPFALKTKTDSFVFFAKSEAERQIWVHELRNLILKDSDPLSREENGFEQTLVSVRGEVMDKIDPIKAFNAWNLSIQRAQKRTRELDQAENVEGQNNQSQNLKQAQIVESNESYVIFIRDGFECYLSQYLRKEPFILDGYLIKEVGSRIKRTLAGPIKRFVVLDQKKQLVRFKVKREDESYKDSKQVPFSELLDAKPVTYDDNRLQGSEFGFKLLVQAMKRQFVFLARSSLEREIWVEGFQKAIIQAKSHEKEQNKADKKMSFKYTSAHLEVNAQSIKGTVMKRIENKTIWHADTGFHQRFLKVEFGNPFFYFYQKITDQAWQKSHNQSDIKNCKALSDEDIEKKIEEKNRQRSRSILKRMSTPETRRCMWNFGFSLELAERTYELYAPTRKERDKWVLVLGAIAEMNSQSIRLDSISPLQFLRNKQAALVSPRQKQPADVGKITNQVQIADPPKQKSTTNPDVPIYERVHHYLRSNQNEMATHELKTKPSYKSDSMHVSESNVRSKCYLVHVPGKELEAQDLRQEGTQEIRMTQIELVANIQFSTLQVLNSGEKVVDQYTFSEVTMASSDNMILDEVLKANRVQRTFSHSFKLSFYNAQSAVFACASSLDRDQWLRVFYLILQMRGLGIDSTKVNPFTFEFFLQRQLFKESSGQDQNQSIDYDSASLPVDTYHSERKDEDLVIPQQDDSDAQSQQFSQNNAAQINASQPQTMQSGGQKNGMPSEYAHLEEGHTAIEQPRPASRLVQLYTATFSLTPNLIEGYLVKAIETKRVIQVTKQHLRFCRIVFETGKLNVKEDKDKSQMRSFQLRDLLSMTIINRPRIVQTARDNIQQETPQILTKKEIESKFPINGAWPYTFRLNFVERSFTLSARTLEEMNEWLRCFRLIILMNKANVSCTDKSPYEFEANKTQHSQMYDFEESKHQFNTEINSFIQEEQQQWQEEDSILTSPIAIFKNADSMAENIDFGISEPILNQASRENEPNNDSIYDNQDSIIHPTTPNVKTTNAQVNAGGSSNPRQRRFQTDRANPRMQQNGLKDSGTTAQATVVNQNITVQNITIHNMNFGGSVINPSLISEERAGGKIEMSQSQRPEMRTQTKTPRPQSAGLRNPTKKMKQLPEALYSKFTLIQDLSEVLAVNASDKIKMHQELEEMVIQLSPGQKAKTKKTSFQEVFDNSKQPGLFPTAEKKNFMDRQKKLVKPQQHSNQQTSLIGKKIRDAFTDDFINPSAACIEKVIALEEFIPQPEPTIKSNQFTLVVGKRKDANRNSKTSFPERKSGPEQLESFVLAQQPSQVDKVVPFSLDESLNDLEVNRQKPKDDIDPSLHNIQTKPIQPQNEQENSKVENDIAVEEFDWRPSDKQPVLEQLKPKVNASSTSLVQLRITSRQTKPINEKSLKWCSEQHDLRVAMTPSKKHEADDSPKMRISLSRIKLAGSNSALGSKQAVNKSMLTSKSSQREVRPGDNKSTRLEKNDTSLSLFRSRPIGGQAPLVSNRSVITLPKYQPQEGNTEGTYGQPMKASINLQTIRLIASRSVRSIGKVNQDNTYQ